MWLWTKNMSFLCSNHHFPELFCDFLDCQHFQHLTRDLTAGGLATALTQMRIRTLWPRNGRGWPKFGQLLGGRGQPGEANSMMTTFKKWLQELVKGRRWPKFAICCNLQWTQDAMSSTQLPWYRTGLIGQNLDNLTILMSKTPQRGRRQLQRGQHWPPYGHKLIFITKNDE
jgi:hypothetical protein